MNIFKKNNFLNLDVPEYTFLLANEDWKFCEVKTYKLLRNDIVEQNKYFKEFLSEAVKYDYILKYITKTDEKIVYSRGIPSNFKDEISEDEICAEFENFVVKFVLFDDIYDDKNCRVLKRLDFGYEIDEISGEVRTE